MSHPEDGLSGSNCLDIPYQENPAKVTGTVAKGSVGCWGDLEDGYVVRHFTLQPWQHIGGAPMSAGLLVLQRVRYEGTLDDMGEDDDWMETFWEQSPELVQRTLTVWISEEEHRAVMISEP